MKLTRLSLRNFRCFTRTDLSFTQRISIITGANGSGKSSILEALYLCGTARSLRTHNLKDVIQAGSDAFSVRAWCAREQGVDELHIGYGRDEQIIELNGVGPTPRKELFMALPVVGSTESDIDIVQGYPERRRMFMDQVAARLDTNHWSLLSQYTQLLKQRTALLGGTQGWHETTYVILTERVWELARHIRRARVHALQQIFLLANESFTRIIGSPEQLMHQYMIPERERGYATPRAWCAAMLEKERTTKRNLCGAHLDDALFFFRALLIQRCGSRGMQKLVSFLLRLAQTRMSGALMLLDDIMADFDEERLKLVLYELEQLSAQLILTAPTNAKTSTTEWVERLGGERISLETLKSKD